MEIGISQTITITAIDANGTGNSSTCSFEVYVECVKVLDIPQFISPHGDGKNDKLVFPGIKSYDMSTLTVFNRNGEIVFQKSPYDNSFDGTSSRTVFLNNNRDNYLPTGTYFYTLIIDDLLQRWCARGSFKNYVD